MLLRASDLPPIADLAAARALLEGWTPPTARQARTREAMLAFVDAHPLDAHRRTLLVGHLTASAIVLDHTRARVLLTLHGKLGRWLQLGGHCDGDANLAGVALREATEESGIEDLAIEPVPIDLDIHPIPARPGEPEHLHLDTRFLVLAGEGARERRSEESTELRWFDERETRRIELDDSVRRLLPITFGRPR
jgi:8-oxo-dGTP pyrophosphatase MutT (NUDIX family)